MASSTTPIPPMRADWTACGACTSGSTAPPRDVTRTASGFAATTNTIASPNRKTLRKTAVLERPFRANASPTWTSPSLQDRDDLRLDWLPCDFDVFIRNVNVNFGSNTKLSFEIDSGLNRKTNAGNDAPRIARLEIVDVNAVAVCFFADGMAGPMCELFAKTCSCDYATRHIVHFRAANRF